MVKIQTTETFVVFGRDRRILSTFVFQCVDGFIKRLVIFIDGFSRLFEFVSNGSWDSTSSCSLNTVESGTLNQVAGVEIGDLPCIPQVLVRRGIESCEGFRRSLQPLVFGVQVGRKVEKACYDGQSCYRCRFHHLHRRVALVCRLPRFVTGDDQSLVRTAPSSHERSLPSFVIRVTSVQVTHPNNTNE